MPFNRVDTEQADVLDAICAQLITSIPALSTKNTFISILPVPPQLPADNLFLTVSPTGGNFPEEFTAGGGQWQCTEDAGVIVAIFSRYQADRPGHERDLLSEFTRGILRMKKLVLKALVGQDPTWNTNFILRNLLAPQTAGAPDYVGDEQLVQVPLKFQTIYDWNLTA